MPIHMFPNVLNNAVPLFQKSITDLVKVDQLKGTLLYLDDILIGGKNEARHDQNVERFLRSCEKSRAPAYLGAYSTGAAHTLNYDIILFHHI